nr:AMP-binding protein [Nocardioides alcanivorans]
MNTNVPVPDPDAPHPFRTQLDAIASLLPEQVALADSAGVRITRVALARLCSAQPPATGPVAVLGTSTPALAAAVAHLYAGAPVSLVDPALVAERLHDVLTRSGATRIVVDPASAPAVEAAAAPGAVEVVDAAWLAAPREPSGAAPTAGTEVDAPASIVWTSGSTGRPKGSR